MVSKQRVEQVKAHARQLRKSAVTMIYEAQSGHPGGSLSCADLVAALYFDVMHVNAQDPKWEDRDRFILSKGHVCPIQYAALAELGYFPKEHLHTLRREGSILQGHPDMKKCPGIEISTGSLGQGLSVGVGMALALKHDGRDACVYVIVGDGEMDEGQIWEALMCANKYHLDNLFVILDNNGLQVDGSAEQIMPHLDLTRKLDAFGFETADIDGHDAAQILETFDAMRANRDGRPKFINAHTVKGKGVSYMENAVIWHGMAPDAQQYAQAMAELEG